MKQLFKNLKKWKPIPLCWLFKKKGWNIPKYLIGHPATEDFETYIEEDPNTRIAISPDRVTFTSLTRNEDAYVYDDKGVDHFAGDFEHLVTVRIGDTATGDWIAWWALTNIVDDWKGITDANGDGLAVTMYSSSIYLRELVAGTEYTTFYSISIDTSYYLRIKRDESVGTYGTLYCDVYGSAADRANEANVLANLSLTLHKKEDFRYIYALDTWNDGDPHSVSGFTEDLDLQEIISKSVSDSGSGAETIGVKRLVPVADSGAGVETLVIKNLLSVLDSGLGADAVSKAIVYFKPVADSGLGSETIFIQLVKAIQDSGMGTDLISAIKAKLLIQESGAGVDQVFISKCVDLVDSGAGVDLINILQKILVQDSGAGVDRIKVPPFYTGKYTPQGDSYTDKYSKQKTKHQDKFFY